MTVREKLSTMEALWEDLSRMPESVKSPDWHGEVLDEREKQVTSGKSRFTEWEKAKKDLRKKAK